MNRNQETNNSAATMLDVSLLSENSDASLGTDRPVGKASSLKRFLNTTIMKAHERKTHDQGTSTNSLDHGGLQQNGSGADIGPQNAENSTSRGVKEKRSRFHFGRNNTKLPEANQSSDATSSDRNHVKGSISTYFSSIFKRKSKANMKSAASSSDANAIEPMTGGEDVHQLNASDETDDDSQFLHELQQKQQQMQQQRKHQQQADNVRGILDDDSEESDEADANAGADVMKRITNDLLKKNFGSHATHSDSTVLQEELEPEPEPEPTGNIKNYSEDPTNEEGIEKMVKPPY